MASGAILPDGTFNICWREALRLFQPHCHDEFAYIVTQTIGGTTTTIYDGVAAHAWYHAGDHPLLTTYRRDAYSCNETGTGDGTAFVYLDLIGDTESHELTTPDSAGWDRVETPNDQSGLLSPWTPATAPAQSRGQPRAHLQLLGSDEGRVGGREVLPDQRHQGR